MNTPSPANRRRVAIVTGGTLGIGSGIADALGEAGYDLLLTYNSNRDAADAYVATLQAKYQGIHIEVVGGDMSHPSTRDLVFECFDTKFTGKVLAATVHNAGQYLGITSTNEDELNATTVALSLIHI